MSEPWFKRVRVMHCTAFEGLTGTLIGLPPALSALASIRFVERSYEC